MTDTHPMLREVLAALTDNVPTLRIFRSPMEVRLEAKRVGYVTPIGMTLNTLRGSTLWHAWTTAGVADAWERLIARGVLPQSFADGPRGFACFCSEAGEGMRNFARAVCKCGGKNYVALPRSMPDLATWTALGAPVILRAEALAGETCAAYGERCDRIVWRIGPIPGVTEGPSLPPAMAVRAMGLAVAEFGNGTATLVCPPV